LQQQQRRWRRLMDGEASTSTLVFVQVINLSFVKSHDKTLLGHSQNLRDKVPCGPISRRISTCFTATPGGCRGRPFDTIFCPEPAVRSMPPRSVQKPARTLALEAAERFAKELHALAVADQNWDEVRESGGIDLLVGLLKMGPCPASTEAAAALTHLAHCVENRDAIRESGGVVLLVKLLAKPHDRPGMEQHDWVATAANAASALRNLTHNNEKNQDAIRDADGVRPLIGLLSHRAPCESSPSGSGPSSAASRAADALGGLARNTHRVNQMAIRDAGGIEQLVALLHEQPIGEAATKAAGALKHLAFAYSANREAIREAGGIEPLVALLELRRDAEEDVMIIAGALWNLGYNNPSNQDAIREAGGVRCARLSPAPLLASPSTLRAPATTLWAPVTTLWTLATTLWAPATTLWAPALRRAAAAHHGAAHPFPPLSCVGPPCSPRRRPRVLSRRRVRARSQAAGATPSDGRRLEGDAERRRRDPQPMPELDSEQGRGA